MRIIVINGPNLNLLKERDKNQYGDLSLNEIESCIKSEFKDIDFTFYQSNIEGEIINAIQNSLKNQDGIIINPGGYSHTSVAIRDALELCTIPKIEVHLSHLVNREEYRQYLITASACNGYISGFKEKGYLAAVYLLKKIMEEKK